MVDIKHVIKTLLHQRFRLLDEKEEASKREYYPQYEKGSDDAMITENAFALSLLGVYVGGFAEPIEMEDRAEERRAA